MSKTTDRLQQVFGDELTPMDIELLDSAKVRRFVANLTSEEHGRRRTKHKPSPVHRKPKLDPPSDEMDY